MQLQIRRGYANTENQTIRKKEDTLVQYSLLRDSENKRREEIPSLDRKAFP